jgi:hypothetical protein
MNNHPTSNELISEILTALKTKVQIFSNQKQQINQPAMYQSTKYQTNQQHKIKKTK